jgi:hypothetical protein
MFRRILKIQGTVRVQCCEVQTTFHENLPVRSEFIALDSQAWWPFNSVFLECRPALGHIQTPRQCKTCGFFVVEGGLDGQDVRLTIHL